MIELEMAMVRRYLRALEDLRDSPVRELSRYATQTLHDMCDPAVGVGECLAPLMTLPTHALTPEEQIVRRMVKSSLS